MTKSTMVERMAIVETKLEDIHNTLTKVDSKIDGLDGKFAGKWVERDIRNLNKTLFRWSGAITVLVAFVTFVVNYLINQG